MKTEGGINDNKTIVQLKYLFRWEVETVGVNKTNEYNKKYLIENFMHRLRNTNDIHLWEHEGSENRKC